MSKQMLSWYSGSNPLNYMWPRRWDH